MWIWPRQKAHALTMGPKKEGQQESLCEFAQQVGKGSCWTSRGRTQARRDVVRWAVKKREPMPPTGGSIFRGLVIRGCRRNKSLGRHAYGKSRHRNEERFWNTKFHINVIRCRLRLGGEENDKACHIGRRISPSGGCRWMDFISSGPIGAHGL